MLAARRWHATVVFLARPCYTTPRCGNPSRTMQPCCALRSTRTHKERSTMNSRIRARAHLSSLALAVALLAGLLGTARPAFAHPLGQASDPIATVMALADAFNKADNATMDALLDPSFEHVTVNPPAGLPPEAVRQNRAQFMMEA